MLSFGFLEKGLEIISPPHFVQDFTKNVFPDCFYFVGYWAIYVLQLPVSQFVIS